MTYIILNKEKRKEIDSFHQVFLEKFFRDFESSEFVCVQDDIFHIGEQVKMCTAATLLHSIDASKSQYLRKPI